VTTDLLKASLGSEQYHSMNSLIAGSSVRCELRDVRLFNTADFDCPRSGSFKTCLGVRLRFPLLFAIGTASIRRGKSMNPDRNLGLSDPGAFAKPISGLSDLGWRRQWVEEIA
jgi:hypothetical protein